MIVRWGVVIEQAASTFTGRGEGQDKTKGRRKILPQAQVVPYLVGAFLNNRK